MTEGWKGAPRTYSGTLAAYTSQLRAAPEPRIALMAQALAKHLNGDTFRDSAKRHAVYIIEDIDPWAAVNLDAEALKVLEGNSEWV